MDTFTVDPNNKLIHSSKVFLLDVIVLSENQCIYDRKKLNIYRIQTSINWVRHFMLNKPLHSLWKSVICSDPICMSVNSVAIEFTTYNSIFLSLGTDITTNLPYD